MQRLLMRVRGAFDRRETWERMVANRDNNRTDARVPNESLMMSRRGDIVGQKPAWPCHGALLRKCP
jgi:hypothetical protein